MSDLLHVAHALGSMTSGCPACEQLKADLERVRRDTKVPELV